MKTPIDETLNTRHRTHGDFDKNASSSQQLKNQVRTHAGFVSGCRPEQREALEMICVKIARILQGDPNCVEHWHDIQGYARLAELSIPPQVKTKKEEEDESSENDPW